MGLLIELPWLEFVYVVKINCLCSCVGNVLIHVFDLGIEVHAPVFVFFAFAFTLTFDIAITITFSVVCWRLWMR